MCSASFSVLVSPDDDHIDGDDNGDDKDEDDYVDGDDTDDANDDDKFHLCYP